MTVLQVAGVASPGCLIRDPGTGMEGRPLLERGQRRSPLCPPSTPRCHSSGAPGSQRDSSADHQPQTSLPFLAPFLPEPFLFPPCLVPRHNFYEFG